MADVKTDEISEESMDDALEAEGAPSKKKMAGKTLVLFVVLPALLVLVGGGVMSATLGTMLQQLEPDWDIRIYERLGDVAGLACESASLRGVRVYHVSPSPTYWDETVSWVPPLYVGFVLPKPS